MKAGKKEIQLSDHFTYSRLIRFVFPSIVMMIFVSIYGVVDGLFVSNYVGKTAFAAINLILPLLMGISALGCMFGTGGSAIVAKTLGEGQKEKAQEYFSMLVYVTIGGGILLSILGLALLRPVGTLMGAEGELLESAVLYGKISMISMVPFMLQNVFQSFFVTAEKPKLGLAVVVIAGVTNMVLDYLFIAVLRLGISGAAIATVCGECFGGLFPIFYFSRENGSLLRLRRAKFYKRVLLKTCTNGSSELMTNLSSSIVNSLYMVQLLRFSRENGVAAYGTIMYANFIFIAIFIGYSIGSAPLISYNYGAGTHAELKNLFKKSLKMVCCTGLVQFGLAQVIAGILAKIFVGYDPDLYVMTKHGFRIFSFSFLISGINIFGSAFFTALNNGPVSALISFSRTLLFQMVVILTLPFILGLDGVWAAVAVAETLALIVTLFFFVSKRKRYKYI